MKKYKVKNRIKELREKLNLTQQELAIIIVTTTKTLKKWEENITIPRLKFAVRLRDYFKVSLDYLIYFEY